MGIGLQAVELAPCHAGLTGQRLSRLLSVPGLSGRRVSPCPFGCREAADPRISSASFPSTMGMLHELLRRTGRWRQSAAVPFRPWEMARTRCLPSAPTAFVGPQRRASGAPRLGTPARLPYQRAYRLLYDPCL